MKKIKKYKSYLLFMLLPLFLFVGCNKSGYIDAYEKGYNDATKQQKTYFEFKNVPYCGDTVITYKTSDIDYDYRMIVVTNNSSANIQLKLFRNMNKNE